MNERDMLSSAYSSVASTIVPDYQRMNKKLNNKNKVQHKNQRFTLKHINKKAKGRGGKNIFPTDFFTG